MAAGNHGSNHGTPRAHLRFARRFENMTNEAQISYCDWISQRRIIALKVLCREGLWSVAERILDIGVPFNQPEVPVQSFPEEYCEYFDSHMLGSDFLPARYACNFKYLIVR